MYPGAKFSTRPASPQFVNFSPPSDYPSAAVVAASAAIPTHNHSMSMRHPKSMASATTSKGMIGGSSRHAEVSGHMVNSSTMGAVGRNDLIFPDDIDSIEFCMPPPPAPSDDMDVSFGLASVGGFIGNGGSVGVDLMMMRGTSNGLCSNEEIFPERRRRGHSRRSNHKMDVEQQVKWTRKNIAATMERFEPSSSSSGSLDYGFAAGVVTPSVTPHHQSITQQHSQVILTQPPLHQPPHQQQQTPINHVYSYAYYEPGAAKCHTNIPHKDALSPIIPTPIAGSSKSPPRNSIRALLAKSFRSRTLNGQLSVQDRHTYTTRYGTTENLYEEVNDQKIRKVLSDNRIATSGSGAVKEELRRVQHNHFRVLDELNLSLEALIMPPTPPDISPTQIEDEQEPISQPQRQSASTSPSAAAAALGVGVSSSSSSSSRSQHAQRQQQQQQQQLQKPSSLLHGSLENLSSTLNSIELKDHISCINPDFDEGDLDSGFSGSGSSSGASYNESLRYYKTGTQCNVMQTTTLPHNLRSCRSSTASGTSTSKSSMNSTEDQGIGMMTAPSAVAATSSPFNYSRRCSDTQRSSARSSSANAGATTVTGAKPKKNFWAIKP